MSNFLYHCSSTHCTAAENSQSQNVKSFSNYVIYVGLREAKSLINFSDWLNGWSSENMPCNFNLSAFSLMIVGILIRISYFRKLKCHSGQYACKRMCFLSKCSAGEKFFPLFWGIKQMSTWRTAELLQHYELWRMPLSTLSSSNATILLSPIHMNHKKYASFCDTMQLKSLKRLVKTRNMPHKV